MNSRTPDEHGNRCSCRLLAEAIGCNPKTIQFEYCRAVLKKHWGVECNHGCHDVVPEVKHSEQWHDIAPMDPVKAILIKNE